MHQEQQYLDLLQRILDEGTDRQDRTGVGTRSLFGAQMRFNISKQFPLFTTKKVWFKGVVHELLWLLSGNTNIKYLKDNSVNIWNEWAQENNNLNSVYGAQWRRWEAPSNKVVLIPKKVGPERLEGSEPCFNRVNLHDLKKTDDMTGKKFVSKKSGEYIVLDRTVVKNKNQQYRVQFTATNFITEASKPNIKNGYVLDPYSKNICDRGFLGQISEKPPYYTSAYNMWRNMMIRCYDPSNPQYHIYGGNNVCVDTYWHCFANFLADLPTIPYFNSWKGNPSEYNLDKDYFGSECYSRDTCIFLTKLHNKELSNHTPIKVRFSDNSETVFFSQKDFAEEYGLDSRRVSEQMLGVRQSFPEFKIERYTPPNNMLCRRQLLVDQIANVIRSLKDSPNSRRHIVSAWNVSQLEEMALPPCHMQMQFYVADGKLSCQMYQRSCDMFLGVPFNVASYSLLTYMIAQVCGLEPGDFVHTLGDLHVYHNHFDQVREQLSRKPRPFPTVNLNSKITDIDDFAFNDVTLDGYDPHPAIKAPIAV